MNILWMGPPNVALSLFFKKRRYQVKYREDVIPFNDPIWDWMDYSISFGYKHIIASDITQHYWGRIINVHISLLPWNRGADPNLWSFLEDTPKGVSIHLIDDGVDTGPILEQKEVQMLANDTLATSYDRLVRQGEVLLVDTFPKYVGRHFKPTPQPNLGTVHKSSDKEKWFSVLKNGWDTPVKDLKGLVDNRGTKN